MNILQIDESIDVPDFSGDDFGNDRQIENRRDEAKAYAKMIDDSLNILARRFQLTKSAHKNLKSFGMIRSLAAVVDYSLSGTLPQGRKLHVSIVSYFSSYPVPRSENSGTDQYIIGFVETKNNFPRTYIHKDSLKEKIADLVLQRDLDFSSNRKFSRSFQVLTEDKNRLRDLLHSEDLDRLAMFPDMEIELYQNGMAFRNSGKAVSINEAIETGNLMEVLFRIFK